MDPVDQPYREQLIRLLDGVGAHMPFEEAVADFPMDAINAFPPNMHYTPWHLVEHVVKLLQYLQTGRNGTPGILGAAFNLPLLHLAYNTLVYAPLLAAFVAGSMMRSRLRFIGACAS